MARAGAVGAAAGTGLLVAGPVGAVAGGIIGSVLGELSWRPPSASGRAGSMATSAAIAGIIGSVFVSSGFRPLSLAQSWDGRRAAQRKQSAMKDWIKRHTASFIVVVGFVSLGIGVFIYSGIYNIGADDHHSRLVFAMLQTLRDRSIELRSASLALPNLDDPALILKGAGQYAGMCTDCHLAPGKKNSEVRVGMYPQPPDLSKARIEPKAAFWVIKHGIKMSAMPAWGSGHDDPTIWSMVAFLRKLPDMSPEDYKSIVARAPPDEDMDMDATNH